MKGQALGLRSGAAVYLPLDEVLDMMRVRILRALRWHEWVSVAELRENLEISSDARARDRFDGHIRKLIKSSAIIRRGPQPHDYQITTRGRAELAGWLRRGQL